MKMLDTELEIVKKYTVQIRDLYETYHKKRQELNKQMDLEIAEHKAEIVKREKDKGGSPWGSTLK